MKKLSSLLLAFGLLFMASCGLQGQQKNVGTQVPELKLSFVKGEVVSVGKPLLLEFWATWCPPCRKSIPHLNEVYAKFKDRGLVVIGVSDEDAATVTEFMKKVPMDYSVAVGDQTLGNHFGIKGIPHALLVSREGKILWEGHPMEMQDADIEKLLK